MTYTSTYMSIFKNLLDPGHFGYIIYRPQVFLTHNPGNLTISQHLSNHQPMVKSRQLTSRFERLAGHGEAILPIFAKNLTKLDHFWLLQRPSSTQKHNERSPAGVHSYMTHTVGKHDFFQKKKRE